MIDGIDLKKPIHLNEWAYNAIKLRILEHQINPGSQLKIDELSKELGISRTPIREALLRLKQDGLVVSTSRVGFFVCGITRKDFDNIFELRQIIEGYAAEKTVDIISDKKIDELVSMNRRCKAFIKQGEIKEYNKNETMLHNTIIDSLDNSKIRDVMSSVEDLLFRIRIYALNSIENMEESVFEHGEVIKAIKSRDAKLARKKMEEHISNIKIRLIDIVDFED